MSYLIIILLFVIIVNIYPLNSLPEYVAMYRLFTNVGAYERRCGSETSSRSCSCRCAGWLETVHEEVLVAAARR